MKRLISKFVFWLLIAIPQVAYAEDQCRDVLAAGLFNTTKSINQSERDAASNAYFCSTGYNEAKSSYKRAQSNNSAGSLGGAYGPWSANGDASQSTADSVSEDQYNLWKSQNCGDSSANEHASDFQYYAQSQVAPKVAQVWLDCMTKRQGLTCWVRPQNEYVMLIVNFNILGSAQGRVIDSFVSNGRSTSTGALNGKIFRNGYTIVAGKRSVAIVRNKDGPIGGAFTLEWSGQSDECDFHVPNALKKAAKSDYRGAVELAVIPRFGCRITAKPCRIEKTYQPNEGYDLCRYDVQTDDVSTVHSFGFFHNGFS